MATPEEDEAHRAGLAVMDAHIEALNARDREGIAATLHFPHYRLAGGRMTVWETSETYLDDFFARAGDGWDHSRWDKRGLIGASADKVHLDVAFTRFHTDGSSLGSFRSIWVISRLEGRWAAQLRSSFAG